MSVSWGQRFSLGRVTAWSLCGYTQALLGAPWGSDSCSQGPAQRLASWAAGSCAFSTPVEGRSRGPVLGGSIEEQVRPVLGSPGSHWGGGATCTARCPQQRLGRPGAHPTSARRTRKLRAHPAVAEPRAGPPSLSVPILLSLQHWQPSQTRLRPLGAAPGLEVGGLLGEAATGDRRRRQKREEGDRSKGGMELVSTVGRLVLQPQDPTGQRRPMGVRFPWAGRGHLAAEKPPQKGAVRCC